MANNITPEIKAKSIQPSLVLNRIFSLEMIPPKITPQPKLVEKEKHNMPTIAKIIRIIFSCLAFLLICRKLPNLFLTILKQIKVVNK